jgi:hypothetical protein
MIQEIIAFLIVAAAFVYLARTFWMIFGSSGKKCGGCSNSCGGKVEKPPQLVQIQINKKP